jgi:hypothetical protein
MRPARDLKMNLYQAQRHAEKNGYDSEEFTAFFPAGPRRCKWLDAYFGMFTIEGLDDGFVMVGHIDSEYPDLVCLPATEPAEA